MQNGEDNKSVFTYTDILDESYCKTCLISSLTLQNTDNKVNSLYIKPEWIDDYNENNASISIQKILDSGYRVLLSKNKVYNIGTKIILNNYAWIEGQGENSVLKAIKGFNTNMIETATPLVKNITLKNFFVNGDIESQSSSFNGINLINNLNIANMHDIQHLWIKNIPGTGLCLKGGGDSYIDDIYVDYCNGYGIDINTFDTTFYKLNVGSIGNDAIHIVGSNNKFIGCKGWWSQGFGIYLEGNRNIVSACDAQDCLKGGLFVSGDNNNILINIDGVGERGPSFRKNDVAAITIALTEKFEYSNFNNITAIITDRMEYFPKEGTIDYLIELCGQYTDSRITYNNITCIFNNIRKALFKNNKLSDSNSYNFHGSIGFYGQTKKDISIFQYSKATGSIKSVNTTKVLVSKVEKYNSTASINYNINPSITNSGTVIGTVSSECVPAFSVDLHCRCYDKDKNYVGDCVVNISNNTGAITIWEVPINTVQIVVTGQYAVC